MEVRCVCIGVGWAGDSERGLDGVRGEVEPMRKFT